MTEAHRIIDLSGDFTSERTAERTRVVLTRLREYDDLPEARDLLNAHGHLLLK